ncbi:MAG: NAD(P)-binding domain-containing protein [Candidatus Cryptobacteroides sp.]
MDRFGLIGDPIKTSGSPALFRAAYSDRVQEDGTPFAYDLIEGSDFESSYSRFLSDYKAVNVTAPFKEKAFAKVLALAKEGKGSISGPVSKIGASNLLVRTDKGVEAHNSDFTGIIVSVAEAYYPGITKEFLGEYGERFFIKIHQFFRACLDRTFTREPQALIVGCGGAGRAAAVAAAEMGFATVLMNRTQEKARAIADALPEYGFIVDPISDFKEAVKECDLVIYTLPAALDEIRELSADDYAGRESGHGKVLLEANYKNPSFGEEERIKMISADATYIEGRKWLLNQALTGYSLMTGLQPGIRAMEEAMNF